MTGASCLKMREEIKEFTRKRPKRMTREGKDGRKVGEIE